MENSKIQRATSITAGFLTLAGLLLMISGVALFAIPVFGPIAGIVALIGGAVIIGLGSLRSGQLDLIYELRLVRAEINDATSNHVARTDTTER
ncbi:membrane-bound ClpP family serine protease [Azospirillum agricola]|uniref:hypothetical protein n=1 Tax=Azospirillum agricola TaxID=1720247 RepID=UPI001AE138B0|nr:hypothetical protein [Azospirillum agricola]MBP2231810.1 membrane-bound ClpP family serine protease [Azospirillum agricola]